MDVLPAQIQLPSAAIDRRHAPPERPYKNYKACLRWEFGFTCAFCLLTEADVCEYSVERTGLFWIEHFLTRIAHPDHRNLYANCLLSCRFCNNSREQTTHAGGLMGGLLDPTKESWAAHFYLEGDDAEYIRPNMADRDAIYTWETYRIDDPEKVARRRMRAQRLSRAIDALDVLPGLATTLEMEACRATEPSVISERLRRAKAVREQLIECRAIVRRYSAIPLTGAPAKCVCKTTPELSLPSWLAAQCRRIPIDAE